MKINLGAWGVVVLILGCAHQPLSKKPPGAGPGQLFVLGDPQIHNVFGAGLKQGSEGADIFVRVAQRRPELNLLAPWLFSDLLERGLAASPALTLVLGDATNVACRGEWDTFNSHLDAALRPTNAMVLLAHGNHDTYLMGTVNSYKPVEDPGFNVDMFDAPLPTDESWWPEQEDPSTSWAGACLAPGRRASEPMNKSIWLNRYLERLKTYGLQFKSSPNGEAGTIISTTVKGDRELEVRGFWYRPGPPRWFERVSKSFIVQSVAHAGHTLILIDTSVCEIARGGAAFADTNAGSHGCLGADQMKIIGEMARKARVSGPVVIAGHFNLAQLRLSDRDWLIELLGELGATYLSAHTHEAPTIRREFLAGPHREFVEEINVGSTTDWPISAQLLNLENGHVVGAQPLRREKPAFTYVGRSALARLFSGAPRGEVCRHLEPARQLATVGEVPTRWFSPAPDEDCRERPFQESQRLLASHLGLIEKRMSEEPAFKKLMLDIATSASEFDSCNGGIP